MEAPKPPNEVRRLAALHRYRILDSAPEQLWDDVAKVAAVVCNTPTAVVNFIDEDRQWTKAAVGFDGGNMPRKDSFCAHTILGTTAMVVHDTATDYRFSDNPLVTGPAGIRFYAGAPLIDSEGHGLGSLCVVDSVPRELAEGQIEALEALSRQVMSQLELRRVTRELAGVLEDVKLLQSILPICSHCKGIRNDEGYWESVENYFRLHADTDFSHSVCPTCFETHYPEVFARMQARTALAGQGAVK